MAIRGLMLASLVTLVTAAQKRAVVGGAGGFIGGHLVKKLQAEGYWVRGVDIKRHDFFDPSPGDEFIVADLRDRTAVEIVIDDSIDEVYQLAADMGGAGYVNAGLNDSNIVHNSMLINLNVADVCANRPKISMVFFSSSACVYPEHHQLDNKNVHLLEEIAYPANPDSEYGWEKLMSERVYLMYKRNRGLNVKIARFHNIFGPMGTWTGGKEKAPAAFMRKVAEAKDGGTIEMWGDGEQTRSFMLVHECIEGILKLCRHPTFFGPVNLGSDEMVTMNEMVDIVSKVAKKVIYIKHIDGPLGVRGRTSENSMIERELGWRPSQKLIDAVSITYPWILEQVQAAAADVRISDEL